MLDDLIATYVIVSGYGAYDVRVKVDRDGTSRYWIVWTNNESGNLAPECNRLYRARESAVLAAEALAMRLHQGGEYATAAEYNRAQELEG